MSKKVESFAQISKKGLKSLKKNDIIVENAINLTKVLENKWYIKKIEKWVKILDKVLKKNYFNC